MFLLLIIIMRIGLLYDENTGEVMVIVEYCRFGNLQNFQIKHREYFIDQIVRDKNEQRKIICQYQKRIID